jgi:hypothetical protein
MDSREWSSGECDNLGGGCAVVRYWFPVFEDSPDDTVAAVLNEQVKSWVMTSLGDSLAYGEIDRFADDFIADYLQVQADFADYTLGWQYNIDVAVGFDTLGILSLNRKIFSFSGGAHPVTTVDFLNLSTATGSQLALDDLLTDDYGEALDQIGERIFRQGKGIDSMAALGEAGYWFEEDRFRLNTNVGIRDSALVFHFNPYEIAPYSLGPTIIEIPHTEIEHLVGSESPLAALFEQ